MDFFTLIPSGSAFSIDKETRIPNASKRQVQAFIENFRSLKTIYCSDRQYAESFYSKTKYIQQTKCKEISEQELKLLLCEFGLLFDQDFGYLSENGSFGHYMQNHAFFHKQAPVKGAVLRLAAEKCNSQLQLQDKNPEIWTVLQGQVTEIIRKKQNLKQIMCDTGTLANNEKDFYQSTVFPELLRKYRWLLWISEGRKHYKRSISMQHCLALDDCLNRMQKYEEAKTTLINWMRTLPLADERIPSFTLTKDHCRLLAQYAQLSAENDSAPFFTDIMYENRDYLYGLFKGICKRLMKIKLLQYESKASKIRVFCEIAQILTPPPEVIHTASRKLWLELGFSKSVPEKDVFTALTQVLPNETAANIPPIQFGILINRFLDIAFPDIQESLAHEDLYLMQQGVVQRYKELYSNDYAEYLIQIKKNAARINEYHVLWCDFMTTTAERRAFLSRRIRYAKPDIPDDPRLWEGVASIEAATSANRTRRVQKCQEELALLVFENALQSCIREQAKETLWLLIWNAVQKK